MDIMMTISQQRRVQRRANEQRRLLDLMRNASEDNAIGRAFRRAATGRKAA